MGRSVVVVLLFLTLLVTNTIAHADTAEIYFLSVGHPSSVNHYLENVVIPRFENDYGIKVHLDSATWNNRTEKILLSIAGGIPYDVVVTAFYSPYEEGGAGLLAPLNKFVRDWEKADRFPVPLWDATEWRGQIYHVPHNIEIRGIAYNKALFGEAGLDPEAPPNSWDEIIDATRYLTRIEGDRVAVRGYKHTSIQEFFWYIHQAGLDNVIDVDNLTSNLNRSEVADALQTLVEIQDAARLTDRMVINDDFDLGRSAMYRHHPQLLLNLRETNPSLVDDYGLFIPRKSPDTPQVAHAYINGLGILDASRNKEAAWNFITMLHEDDIRFEIERISGYVSGRMDMVVPMMEVLPKIELFYELFAHLQASVLPPPRNLSQENLRRMLLQVYNKEIPPETMLTESHELWNRLLDEWKITLK